MREEGPAAEAGEEGGAKVLERGEKGEKCAGRWVRFEERGAGGGRERRRGLGDEE
jgi:hypothetical protein